MDKDGSVEIVKVDGNRREYQLFSADFDKLPKDGIGAGSTALVLDTGDIYIFHAETKTWNLF